MNWKPFIRASSLSSNNSDFETKHERLNKTGQGLDGKEIRTFYEETVSQRGKQSTNALPIVQLQPNSNEILQACKTSSCSFRQPTQSRKPDSQLQHHNVAKISTIEWSSEKLINKFMKAAQEDDAVTLKQCIMEGCDVNVCDSYGWTALMCAMCSGALNAVKALVEIGADVNIKNYKGASVWELAQKQKNKQVRHVVQWLRNVTNPIGGIGQKCTSELVSAESSEEPYAPGLSKFYCRICKLEFKETTTEQHQSSTLHLFNSKLKIMPPQYYIPESNVGYQLLLKDGWDKEKGLGPDGQGQKFPVKTVLKQDRKGLGNKHGIPKVTHFKPMDVSAVKRRKNYKRTERTTTLSKKARSVQIEKEKWKEINFRRMFN